jgi:acyl-coenzyme A thioesterase 9
LNTKAQEKSSTHVSSTLSSTPRRMHNSYSQISLPFASSSELFEQYTNASGTIRLGKLLEHLDSLAGSIAYKHMLGPDVQTLGEIEERGFYIVTAAVDRLDLLQSEMFVGGEKRNAGEGKVKDLVLSGHVAYVGRSSMEIVVKMETPEDGRTLMIGKHVVLRTR